ncbi:hypothetical protein GA840_03725 [Pediococcus ethanolidurans]|uniref:LasU family protein n=1 Tax=Pediococcus ethanolidurans TaxID=319653 RepID=UPI002954E63F|nr:LasU family protein [Pediococcus ethanolidurans]MDV7718958.1 hypothetical protein [Pediococcus ethanolidurans]
MRKTLEIIPTFILILTFIYSLYLKSVNGVWVNWFVFSLVGLGVYTTIIIFIDAIMLTGRGDKGTGLKSKIFYSYLIVLLIATIILAFYLMTHN